MIARCPLAFLSLALGTASTGLGFQVADVSVELFGLDVLNPVPGAPLTFDDLKAGADFGWVVGCSVDLPGVGIKYALFGDLTPGSVTGGQLLRVPSTIAGYAQTHLKNPSTASGRLAYLDNPMSSSSSTGTSAWIDDRRIATVGDVIGTSGATWLRLRDIVHLADGSTYIRGGVERAGVAGDAVALYPGGSSVLQTGDVLPGLPGPIDAVPEFHVSAGGVHWIARVTAGPLSTSAIVLDGAVLQVPGGSVAIEGTTVPAAVGGAGSTWSRFESVAVNDAADVAFATHVLGGASPSPTVVRNGRRVTPAFASGGLPLVQALDPRGFVATLESGLEAVAESVWLSGAGTTVDVDGDDMADLGWSLGVAGFPAGYALAADGTDLYWVVQVRGPSSVRPDAVVRMNRYGIAQATCAGRANSTGRPARMMSLGSIDAQRNDVVLHCIELPTASAGLFLTSLTAGFTAQPGGSQGDLCLAGAIGRYNAPPFLADGTGRATLAIDLQSMPQPTGAITAVPGSTWYFQAWYRDTAGGQATSNFSDAVVLPWQ